MRNLKRFLAMVLTVLMVAGCFASISAKEFEDIDSDYAYAQAIDVLSDLGIIQGYGDDFKPDVDLARWHMALFLARLDSARVETADTIRIWYEEDNYTPFKDLTNATPIAAINYVYNFNMIVGTSATTFSPEDGITLQDALTMVVRALGYGSAEMDAGYPWKYIGKANELGLTDGLNAGVSYTDVLNRGEMAQVLYNALYAVKADGSSYADKFIAPAGETAVIITGVKGYKIAAVESVKIDGYVSVNLLKADGTLNTDVTYFLPASEFGFDAATKELVGRAFLVNTSDDFKTLDQCDPCAFETYDTEDFNGYAWNTTNANANSTKLTIDGVDYKIVSSYSFLFNNQGVSKDGSNELMVFGYAKADTDKNTNDNFQYDSNYNILAANGLVAAYYVPAITGSYDAPYAFKLAEGVYEPIADTIVPNYVKDADGNEVQDGYKIDTWEEKVKRAIANDYVATSATYGAFSESTTTIYATDRFASIDAYDDDNDGLYERAFYKFWSFGQYVFLGGNPAQASVAGNVSAAGNFVAANEDVKFNSGDFVRYTFDAMTGVYTIDKVYAWENIGKVVSVSGNSFTATLNNETKTYATNGIANYPGASAVSSADLIGLYGYNVSVLTETDSNGNVVVLKIKKTDTDTRLLVLDNIVAMSTNGYVKATAYDLRSGETKIIDIATINGYEYQQYVLVSKLYSIYNQLASGQLWTAVLDKVSGNYHLISMVDLKTVGNDYGTLKFDQYTYKLDDGVAHVANAPVAGSFLPQLPTVDSTVTIIRYSNDLPLDGRYNEDKYIVRVGKLTYNDELLNITRAKYYVEYNKNAQGVDVSIKVLFIDLTDCYNAEIKFSDNNKIVFVPVTANVSASTDGILGQAYTYTGLAMSNGEYSTAADVMTSYNARLEVGKFYRIENKYVEDYFDAADAKFEKVTAANEAGKRVIVIDTKTNTTAQQNGGEWYVIKGTRLAIKSVDEAMKAADAAGKTAADAKAAAEKAIVEYDLAKAKADAALEAAYRALYEAVDAEERAASYAADKNVIADAAVAAANEAIEAMNKAADAANELIAAYNKLVEKDAQIAACEKYDVLTDAAVAQIRVDYRNAIRVIFDLGATFLYNFDDITSMIKTVKALNIDLITAQSEVVAAVIGAQADSKAVKAYLAGDIAAAKGYWNTAVELYKLAGATELKAAWYSVDFNSYINAATASERAEKIVAFVAAL